MHMLRQAGLTSLKLSEKPAAATSLDLSEMEEDAQPLSQIARYGLWSMVYGLWSMVYGLWSMVNGQWSLVNGHWSMVIGQWSLVNGHWSMVIGQWSMVNGQWSMVNGQWSMVYGLWSMVYGLCLCPLSSYFCASKDGNVQKNQTGVFRTNCIDCLDRTNVVQSLLGKRMLLIQ